MWEAQLNWKKKSYFFCILLFWAEILNLLRKEPSHMSWMSRLLHPVSHFYKMRNLVFLLHVGYDTLGWWQRVNAHGQGPLPHQWVVVHSIEKMTFWLSETSEFSSPCVRINTYLATGIGNASLPEQSDSVILRKAKTWLKRKKRCVICTFALKVYCTLWYAHFFREHYVLSSCLIIPPPLYLTYEFSWQLW